MVAALLLSASRQATLMLAILPSGKSVMSENAESAGGQWDRRQLHRDWRTRPLRPPGQARTERGLARYFSASRPTLLQTGAAETAAHDRAGGQHMYCGWPRSSSLFHTVL
jgi:hypothetical protein